MKQAAAQGRYPTAYVSTVPAELLETEGPPAHEPIDGTILLDSPGCITTAPLSKTGGS